MSLPFLSESSSSKLFNVGGQEGQDDRRLSIALQSQQEKTPAYCSDYDKYKLHCTHGK